MSKSIRKLAVLVALSDMTEHQVYESIDWIRDFGEDAFLDLVHGFKNVLTHSDLYFGPHVYQNRPKRNDEISELASKVQRILIKESRLTKAQAAAMLYSEFISDNLLDEKNIPPLGRQNFSKWIDRLSEQIDPSQLLYYATKIRNNIVHNKNDWKLKDND